MDKTDRFLFKIMVIGAILLFTGVAMPSIPSDYSDNAEYIQFNDCIYNKKMIRQVLIEKDSDTQYWIIIDGTRFVYRSKEDCYKDFGVIANKLGMKCQIQ